MSDVASDKEDDKEEDAPPAKKRPESSGAAAAPDSGSTSSSSATASGGGTSASGALGSTPPMLGTETATVAEPVVVAIEWDETFRNPTIRFSSLRYPVAGMSGRAQGDHVTAYTTFIEALVSGCNEEEFMAIPIKLASIAKGIISDEAKHGKYDVLVTRATAGIISSVRRREIVKATRLRGDPDVDAQNEALKRGQIATVTASIQEICKNFLRDIQAEPYIAFARTGKTDRGALGRQGRAIQDATRALRGGERLSVVEIIKHINVLFDFKYEERAATIDVRNRLPALINVVARHIITMFNAFPYLQERTNRDTIVNDFLQTVVDNNGWRQLKVGDRKKSLSVATLKKEVLEKMNDTFTALKIATTSVSAAPASPRRRVS